MDITSTLQQRSQEMTQGRSRKERYVFNVGDIVDNFKRICYLHVVYPASASDMQCCHESEPPAPWRIGKPVPTESLSSEMRISYHKIYATSLSSRSSSDPMSISESIDNGIHRPGQMGLSLVMSYENLYATSAPTTTPHVLPKI